MGYAPNGRLWAQAFGDPYGSNSSPYCGNGFREGGEECDDRNTMSGDGCSSACQVESGFACTERGVFEQADACVFSGSGATPYERHDAVTTCELRDGNFAERANVNFVTNFQLDAGNCGHGQAFRWMRDDAVRRHNYFRYLAHVPVLPVSESRQDLAQQCALMIASNFEVHLFIYLFQRKIKNQQFVLIYLLLLFLIVVVSCIARSKFTSEQLELSQRWCC